MSEELLEKGLKSDETRKMEVEGKVEPPQEATPIGQLLSALYWQ
jgi:hypothetical protein